MNNLTNSVTLVGNIGQDIELITLESGSRIAKASIATNHYYKNKSGEKVQEVDWHNIVAWNKTADLMSQLLKKGSKVMVQGMLKNETYKNKDGEVRYATKIQVNGFQVLTPKEAAMPF